jgi:hypothetical protein
LLIMDNTTGFTNPVPYPADFVLRMH